MSNIIGMRPLAGANPTVSMSGKVDRSRGVVAFAVAAFVCAVLALPVAAATNAPLPVDPMVLYGP